MATRNSSRDMLQLVAELNYRRMPMVFDLWHRHQFGSRLQGMQDISRLVALMGSDDLEAYKTVRDLHWRYESGKLGHTDQELGQVLRFCRFLVRLHAHCKHQQPQEFDIDQAKMSCAEELPKGAYAESLEIVGVM